VTLWRYSVGDQIPLHPQGFSSSKSEVDGVIHGGIGATVLSRAECNSVDFARVYIVDALGV
jgi:hypothetical protein